MQERTFSYIVFIRLGCLLYTLGIIAGYGHFFTTPQPLIVWGLCVITYIFGSVGLRLVKVWQSRQGATAGRSLEQLDFDKGEVNHDRVATGQVYNEGRRWRTWGTHGLLMGIVIGLALWAYVDTRNSMQAYLGYNAFFVGKQQIADAEIDGMPEIVERYDGKVYRVPIQLRRVKVDNRPIYTLPNAVGAYLYLPVSQAAAEQLLPQVRLMVRADICRLTARPEEHEINLLTRYITDGRLVTLQNAILLEEPQPITEGYALGRTLGIWRFRLQEVLTAYLPARLAPVMSALLWGGQYGDIEESIMDDFTTTGLIHILSVSGSHIALLLGGILTIGKRWRIPLLWLGLSSCILLGVYLSLVGFAVPAVRAATMGLVSLLGIGTKRRYNATHALTLVGWLFLLYRPLLLFDVSFQLSLLATLGICVLYKPCRQWFVRLPALWREPLALLLAVYIVLLPLQLYYFQNLSLSIILGAVLVGPLLEGLILSGYILSFLTWAGLPCIVLWKLLGYVLTQGMYMMHMVTFLPGAVIYISSLSSLRWLLYWITVACLVYLQHKPKYWQWEGYRALGMKSLEIRRIIGGLIVLFCILLIPYEGFEPCVHTIVLREGPCILFCRYAPAEGVLWLGSTNQHTLSAWSLHKIERTCVRYGLRRIIYWRTSQNEDNGKLLQQRLQRQREGVQFLYCDQKHWQHGIWQGVLIGERRGLVSVALANETEMYLLSNGQNSEKLLQLNEGCRLLGLAIGQGNLQLWQMWRQQYPTLPCIYWGSYNKRAEVDAKEADLYVVGQEEVPDIIFTGQRRL